MRKLFAVLTLAAASTFCIPQPANAAKVVVVVRHHRHHYNYCRYHYCR